jgi:histidinol-phosphatase
MALLPTVASACIPVVTRADLRIALEAADAADRITMGYFRNPDLKVDTKDDATPVTEADQGAERAIREVLVAARPDDAIAGEEYGESGDSVRRWIIDPIDATVNYMRGVPVWGTLIALDDGDGISVGVVSSPALGHRWWAGRGLGAHLNAVPMRVSTIETIEAAHLSFNSLVTLGEYGLGQHGMALSQRCERTRGFGDFLSFMFLADGAVDIVVEPVAKEWDLAPLEVIVSEAGGRFTDLDGHRTVRGGNAVATNGLLHDEVLEVLRAAPTNS